MSERCAAKLFGNSDYYHQCYRDGSIEEEGKWWCRQHAPSSVAAREKARKERHQAKWDAINHEPVKRYSVEEMRELAEAAPSDLSMWQFLDHVQEQEKSA